MTATIIPVAHPCEWRSCRVMIGGRYEPAVVRVKEVTVGRGVRGKMGEVQGPIATSGLPSGRMPAVAKCGAPAAKKRNPTESATAGATPSARKRGRVCA